jgi:HAD superfamily hydrolase (TIGR01490 family)
VAVGAFFDVDGTLIARNSAQLYLRHLRRSGQARRRDVAWTVYYLARYKLGLLDVDVALEDAMRFARGRTEADVRADARDWYARDVRRWLYPQMRALVAAHRQAGHLTIIATSATRYLAEPLAEEIGIERFLVSRLVVRDGIFTGEAVRPLCYGAGKLHWARELAASAGVDLGASYFYTDSITDLPLLDAVGHPRIVHPDPRLRRLAQRRGWPVLRPSLAETSAVPLAAVGT